jgi:maleate isomerase
VNYVRKTHRFGLLTPSSNTTQEPEFVAALPPSVSLHTGRVTYRDITPAEQDRCVLELEQESRKLADAEVDVIVFAATAPTLAKGKGYDRELIKRMEDASGRPATTAATAFVDALTRLGAKKIAIGAPWSKAMDKPMVAFMEASGFKVVHSEVVGFVASIELGRVGPETAYELARKTDRPDADAIIMPGGNWASMPMVERLERELGKPVLEQRSQPVGGAPPAQAQRQHCRLWRAVARPSRESVIGRQESGVRSQDILTLLSPDTRLLIPDSWFSLRSASAGTGSPSVPG